MRPGTDEEKKVTAIESLAARVRERWPGEEAGQVEQFVRQYYGGVAPEDIKPRGVADLYGAALSHWSLGHRRRADQPVIHVYNPDPEQNGWESTHTVVEIVTDDMPFLVDSVSMALNAHGLTVHLIIHPVLAVRRDRGGRLRTICEHAEEQGVRQEAWMHFEVDREVEPERLRILHDSVASVIADVRAAVDDWKPMRAQLERVINSLQRSRPPVDSDYLDEVLEFLRWVHADHFTFIGYRRYDLRRRKAGDELHATADSGLGVLRRARGGTASSSFAALPEEVRLRARDQDPLIVTKSNTRATVHRRGYMDYIGIKRYNAKHEVIGEHRFLGLFTSAAYNVNPRTIPLLRRKIDYVLRRSNLLPKSHSGKALVNILETHPRDELLQATGEELFGTASGILHLQERQRVRLFVRYDTFRRFVSCLVYCPRERYSTEVRERMEVIFADAFDAAQTEFSVRLSESVLARIHFIVRLEEPGHPEFEHAALEQRLAQTLRSWTDDLADALLDHFGEARGNQLFRRYGLGFNAAYREDMNPRAAAHDIERLEILRGGETLALALYRPLEADAGLLRLKLYQPGGPVILSDALPVLENMGVRVVDEHPYDVERDDGTTCWIHDFGLRHAGSDPLEAERVREDFQDAFAAVWGRRVEDDGFNRLVLAARLGWRDIVVLRAYAHYLRQAGTLYSASFQEATLARNARIARLLVALFHARFDPDHHDDERAERIGTEIEGLLEDVESLEEDRILRRFLAAIQATLRTNHFRTDADGGPRPCLSLKLAPEGIPFIPKPVPKYEIFVYSPRMEGVHLRGNKVARGGIRWSERREDYRTEVLGLMKAQMVKNAVIVPVGAKGGFVCKRLPDERQAMFDEVLDCYRSFIRGLLDVTDNIVDGTTEAPAQVVRHDDDDPYLVVAADKGTATFSDHANAVAEEYGFWLRDAFASGGSTGYDHKKMGITARGGWVAVQRHFREMGRDVQSEPFTAVGVGDMSGDVFGNGMLRSEHTRLIAAFDHRHVFIDPDPDPAASFVERQRLFRKDRSSWADYDTGKISEGGGVWPRTAKSIPLSKQARQALAIDAQRLTPNELISAILCAPVDLLWNGGIGTYIKASHESQAEVGDKANDAVRVDAAELRCRVVGEGGNLGVTQRGRVEFALPGGRINTDAIDNSGGVDCSDHEVNIKILLNGVVDAGDLTMKQRNRLLVDMTEEVADLVLQDNYRQTQGLSLTEAQASEQIDEHARLIRSLERAGRLDRHVEQLPDDEGITERQKSGRGLARPELAVLQAYAKIEGYQELVHADVVTAAYLHAELMDYFPRPIRERFPDAVGGHPLRAEIVATVVTNHIVNRMGPAFFFRMETTTGANTPDTVRAYFAARDVFGLRALWHQADQLDNKAAANVQARLLLRLCELQERATTWLLRNLASPIDIKEASARIRPAISQLEESLDTLLPEADLQRLAGAADAWEADGVPAALARRIARLDHLYPTLDLVKVSADTGVELAHTARVYFAAGSRLELDWLRERLAGFEVGDPWEERYREGLEDELFVQRRRLTVRILHHSGDVGPDDRVGDWAEANEATVQRLQRTLAELRRASHVDLPMLGVALQELRNAGQAGAAERLLKT